MLKVIGANGNVGRRLLEKSSDKVEVIKTRLDKHQLDYDFQSLTNKDTIAFCAAISEPTVCANNPELAIMVNVEKTIEFIEKSIQYGARVIFLSSDAVINNVGIYARLKFEVEKYFLDNSNVKVLRSSYNFFREDRFTSYLEKCALNNEVAEVFSPFERYVIHRDDTVDSILSLSKKWIGSQIINCGGLENVCRKKFAEVLKEEVFPDLKLKIVKPPESFYKDRPSSIEMSSTELSSILGRPQRNLREAIRMEFS
tara:strand:+ start:2686 stop:3450 length:765 start_codon:yes stop_codon:yes gene_type:complete